MFHAIFGKRLHTCMVLKLIYGPDLLKVLLLGMNGMLGLKCFRFEKYQEHDKINKTDPRGILRENLYFHYFRTTYNQFFLFTSANYQTLINR